MVSATETLMKMGTEVPFTEVKSKRVSSVFSPILDYIAATQPPAEEGRFELGVCHIRVKVHPRFQLPRDIIPSCYVPSGSQSTNETETIKTRYTSHQNTCHDENHKGLSCRVYYRTQDELCRKDKTDKISALLHVYLESDSDREREIHTMYVERLGGAVRARDLPAVKTVCSELQHRLPDLFSSIQKSPRRWSREDDKFMSSCVREAVRIHDRSKTPVCNLDLVTLLVETYGMSAAVTGDYAGNGTNALHQAGYEWDMDVLYYFLSLPNPRDVEALLFKKSDGGWLPLHAFANSPQRSKRAPNITDEEVERALHSICVRMSEMRPGWIERHKAEVCGFISRHYSPQASATLARTLDYFFESFEDASTTPCSNGAWRVNVPEVHRLDYWSPFIWAQRHKTRFVSNVAEVEQKGGKTKKRKRC